MTAPFRFKLFTVHQDRCAMKVGTDAILLGTWAHAADSNASAILDIGTGTGILALMLAQRFSSAVIDAVDIDPDAYHQASANIQNSPWSDRISAAHTAIQQFHPERRYDLIVSNPPWFQNSLKPNHDSRRTARHTDTLSSEALIKSVVRLIRPGGCFCTIVPAQHADEFVDIGASHNLHCCNRTLVKPTPQKPPKRHLLHFTATISDNTPCRTQQLAVELQRHQYSPEFRQLARDFLLKL